MMKKASKRIIRLTESDLRRVVRESVNRILEEGADHLYGGETLNADNSVDWATLYLLRKRKALDAGDAEAPKPGYVGRQYRVGDNDRRYAILHGWSNDLFDRAEEKSNRIIPRTRPQGVLDRRRELKDMLLDAVDKYGCETDREGNDYIWLKMHTSDGLSCIYLKHEDYLADDLWDRIDYEFRNEIIGFKPHFYDGEVSYYEPCFTDEAQKMWDDGVRRYQQGVMDYYASKRSGDYTGD